MQGGGGWRPCWRGARSERREGEREGVLRRRNVRAKGKDWRTSAARWERSNMLCLKDLLSLLCKYQSRPQQTNVLKRITSLFWVTNVFMLITRLTHSYRCSVACFKVELVGAPPPPCDTMKKSCKLTVIRCFILRFFQEGHCNSSKITLRLVCQCARKKLFH